MIFTLTLIYYVQTDTGHHRATYTSSTGGLSLESSGRGVKLTTHIHLAPRLRISAALPLLPPTFPRGVASDNLTTLPFLSHVVHSTTV